MITEELKKLYTVHTGHEPETIDELPSSGSNRRYFRLKGDEVIPKTDPLVTTLRDLVAELYAQGRNTVMGDEELEIMVRTIDTERYEHLLFHKSH